MTIIGNILFKTSGYVELAGLIAWIVIPPISFATIVIAPSVDAGRGDHKVKSKVSKFALGTFLVAAGTIFSRRISSSFMENIFRRRYEASFLEFTDTINLNCHLLMWCSGGVFLSTRTLPWCFGAKLEPLMDYSKLPYLVGKYRPGRWLRE